jgi:uncharacterized protein YkwD
MRRIAALLAISVGLVVALPAASAPAKSAEVTMYDKINSIRKANGLRELRGSWSLVLSAKRYARSMMRADYFGHQARIPVASGWGAVGETLSWHRGWAAKPRQTVSRWMHSPGHRALLLSSRFRRIGMGKARGNYAGTRATMWVVHVGRR